MKIHQPRILENIFVKLKREEKFKKLTVITAAANFYKNEIDTQLCISMSEDFFKLSLRIIELQCY